MGVRTKKGHIKLVDDWKAVPIGAKVVVKMDDGELRETITCSEPIISKSGTSVIVVGGISGYYLLDRVKLACGVCGHIEVHCLASGCNHKEADNNYCECQVWHDQKLGLAPIAADPSFLMIWSATFKATAEDRAEAIAALQGAYGHSIDVEEMADALAKARGRMADRIRRAFEREFAPTPDHREHSAAIQLLRTIIKREAGG